jgi:Glycosyltransferase family 87
MDVRLRSTLTLLTVAALAAAVVPTSRLGGVGYSTVAVVFHAVALSLAVAACTLAPRSLPRFPRAARPILLCAVGSALAGHAVVYLWMGWAEESPIPNMDGVATSGPAVVVAYILTALLAGVVVVGAPWARNQDVLLGPLAVALVGEGVLCGAQCGGHPEWANWGMYIPSLVGFAAVVALALGAGRSRWTGVALFAILFIAGMTLRFDAVLGVPNPHIDVYEEFAEGNRRLLAGRNCYEFFNRINLPFYPPLPHLLMLPFQAVGLDLRLANVVFDLVAVFCLYLAARPRHSTGERQQALLLTACYLFFPRTPMMFQLTWYEPMLAAGFGLGLLLVRRSMGVGFFLIGLALVGKQMGIVLLPVLFRAFWQRRVALALGILVAGLVSILPFLVWDPLAFVNVVFTHHLLLDVRPDSNSLQSAMIHLFVLPGSEFLLISRGVCFLISVALIAWITWRTPSDGTCPAIWMATALLAFFFLHSQAFYNYYHLCVYLFLFGLARESINGSGPERRAEWTSP